MVGGKGSLPINTNTWPLGYKILFMLNSTECDSEISNVLKNCGKIDVFLLSNSQMVISC